jgi:hypothetical protein
MGFSLIDFSGVPDIENYILYISYRTVSKQKISRNLGDLLIGPAVKNFDLAGRTSAGRRSQKSMNANDAGRGGQPAARFGTDGGDGSRVLVFDEPRDDTER